MPDLKPLVLNPPMNISFVTNRAGIADLHDFIISNPIQGWDIETDVKKDFFWRRCRTMQFGLPEKQFMVDLWELLGRDSNLLFECQGNYGKNLPPIMLELMEAISPVVCSPDFLKVGVMLSFEYMTHYWNFGLRTTGFYDCAVAEKCIWAGMDGSASLKNYSFYSMEEMMERYFGLEIDKSLQESFTLDTALTEEQKIYGCVDIRTPLSIRRAQMPILAGYTPETAYKAGLPKIAEQLKKYPSILLGDKLSEIVDVENSCIGAFQDMHIHGETIDVKKWGERVEQKKKDVQVAFDTLDKMLIPLVGDKHNIITEEEVKAADDKWKAFRTVTPEEVQLKRFIRKAEDGRLETELLRKLESERLGLKEKYKKEHSELGKKRTKINNLVTECQGNALINYNSNPQLLKVLQGIKGLTSIKSTGDEVLEKYLHIPIIKVLQEYRGIAKELSTYGEAWITKWTTKPCKEEGWLHPGDGKIHHVYNQNAAETGRSSSEKPNGQNIPQDESYRSCFIADPLTEEDPDEKVYVTADMSGAELRIIADRSGDPTWIGCFQRGEDVHSVSTEILNPEEWPKHALPDCAYYKLKENGEPARKKCKCPGHKELRNEGKAPNFLLAYGGGAGKLASELKKPVKYCKELMARHERAFPNIWAYLAASGKKAQMLRRAFDMWGRRRLFPEPTWERAVEKAKSDREEKLRYPDHICQENVANFLLSKGRKPKKDEKYILEHREPTSGEIGNAFQALGWAMERQGKNHEIQGTNATIAKIAMAILWEILPKYKATLVKFVHDELVVMCPKQYGEDVAREIGEAFKKAAAIKMKRVIMEFDFNIGPCWRK